MPQDTRVGVGVACLVFRDFHDGPRVLLGLRKGSHAADLWSTPGGWLEFGEIFESAAIRELHEETGIAPVRRDFRPQQVMVANTCMEEEGRQFVTIYMLFRGPDTYGAAQLLEPEKCGSWCWCPLGELPEPLFPSVAEAIATAVPLLKG